MNNFTTKHVHKSMITAGDCIEHEGRQMTVSRNNITRSEFMGLCLFGDSYQLGQKLVKLIKLFENQKIVGFLVNK